MGEVPGKSDARLNSFGLGDLGALGGSSDCRIQVQPPGICAPTSRRHSRNRSRIPAAVAERRDEP